MYVRTYIYMSMNSSYNSECCSTKLGRGTKWVIGMIWGYVFLNLFSIFLLGGQKNMWIDFASQFVKMANVKLSVRVVIELTTE